MRQGGKEGLLHIASMAVIAFAPIIVFPPAAVANLPALAGAALRLSRFAAMGFPFLLRGKKERRDGVGELAAAGGFDPESSDKGNRPFVRPLEGKLVASGKMLQAQISSCFCTKGCQFCIFTVSRCSCLKMV